MDSRLETGDRGAANDTTRKDTTRKDTTRKDTERKDQVDRRRFLASGLVTAGTVALGTGSVSATSSTPAAPPATTREEDVIRNAHGTPLRRFGRTGWVLPVFGAGGSAMVDRWSSAYNVQLGSIAGDLA